MALNDSTVYFSYFGLFDAGPFSRVQGFFSNTGHSHEKIILANGLVLVTILRIVLNRHRYILIFPILLLFGFIVGTILRQVNTDNEYDSSTEFFIPYVVHVGAIIYGFYITYFVDYYAFRRNVLQVIPLSLILFICHLLIVTGVAYPIMYQTYEWPIEVSFSVALSLAPTELTHLIARFEGVERYVKDIQDILQGSELLIYVFLTSISYILLVILTASGKHIVAEILWQILCIPFSLIFSLCMRRSLKYVSASPEMFFLYVTSCAFLAYFVSKSLGLLGTVAVIVTGVVFKISKVTLNAGGSQFVADMWELVYRLFSYCVFVLLGIIIGAIENQCSWNDLGFVLAIYLTCYFGRFVAMMVSSSFLIKRGNQITWRHIKVGAWGVNRGLPTIIMALALARFFPPYKYRLIVYSTCIACLSMFFNGVLATGLLRIEGMYELTRSRIVNMNGAMARINQCRMRSIFSLKMDIIVSDANWWIVEITSRLRHPYSKKLKGASNAEDLGDDVQVRFVKCSICGTETLAPLTKREFDTMLNDAKQRIMKTQMVSYFKQNDQETLPIEGLRYLINLVELAFAREAMLYSEDVKIQSEGSRTQLFFLKSFQWLQEATWVTYTYVPKNKLRHLIFLYTTSHQFRIVHSIIAFVDIALNISMNVLFYEHDEGQVDRESEGFWLQLLDLMFCIYFFIEFTLQVLGIGFSQYFSQQVNIVEFTVSIMMRPFEVFLALYLASNSTDSKYTIFEDDEARICFAMKFLHLLRLSRLYVLVAAISPQLVSMIERKINNDIMRSYDIGKAYLMSTDRVSRILATMVNNDGVLNELRKMIEQERMKMSKELGLIQKDNPSIAVTVKTRHAIRSVVNTINDCLSDMKEEGILDFIEHKCLLESLDEVKKDLREIEWVDPCPPDTLLAQIPWLSEKGADFFLQHAELQNYDFNDVLIRHGDDPVGIYILVSGLLKCTYKPTPTSLQLSNKFGVLPNYDFFSNMKFSEPQEEMAVTGNVIGEIGLVTGRRYDMTVACDTAVQAYFVPWEIVRELVYESPDSDVIQARIWKTIGTRIALTLLEMDRHFQNWDRSKLLIYIDRGVVPVLNDIRCLNFGQFLDEVILIEGVIMDRMTRVTYFAPFHLPKTIHRVLLPEHPGWDFHTVYETKLLLIPNAGFGEDFIFNEQALFHDHFIEFPLPEVTSTAPADASEGSASLKGAEIRKRKAVGFTSGESQPPVMDVDSEAHDAKSQE